MNSLQDQERLRLKRYGDMLKNEAESRKNYERFLKESALVEDSRDLQKHIQQTRRYEYLKRLEKKELQHAIRDDNLRLSSIKKDWQNGEELKGENFMAHIQELQGKRLAKLKEGLMQQSQQNHENISYKRQLEEKIREIEKQEEKRHTEKVKEQQLNSERNYEQIKRRYQQDMGLYERHRRLMENNENYREQIESFTQGKGILDNIYRNEYSQRKGELKDHQEQIIKQMQQFQRRKERETTQYKRSVGDLESSIFSSMVMKPENNRSRALSYELRNQMSEDYRRKMQEERAKKERVEMSAIYGTVKNRDREKMVKIVDRTLGLDQYDSKPKREERPQQVYDNPESPSYPQQQSPARPSSKQKNSSLYDQSIPISASQHFTLPSLPNIEAPQSNRKYFKSYDFITGKDRFYGSD